MKTFRSGLYSEDARQACRRAIQGISTIFDRQVRIDFNGELVIDVDSGWYRDVFSFRGILVNACRESRSSGDYEVLFFGDWLDQVPEEKLVERHGKELVARMKGTPRDPFKTERARILSEEVNAAKSRARNDLDKIRADMAARTGELEKKTFQIKNEAESKIEQRKRELEEEIARLFRLANDEQEEEKKAID